jgi:hypothetical protein
LKADDFGLEIDLGNKNLGRVSLERFQWGEKKEPSPTECEKTN